MNCMKILAKLACFSVTKCNGNQDDDHQQVLGLHIWQFQWPFLLQSNDHGGNFRT